MRSAKIVWHAVVVSIGAAGLHIKSADAAPADIVYLGSFGQIRNSVSDLNDSGVVVGSAAKNNLPPFWQTRGFRHSGAAGSGLVDLGTLGGNYSEANGINAQGVIVGSAYLNGNTVHAFVHPGTPDGVMQDLGTLGGRGRASFATAINNSGTIVGYSYDDDGGTVHPFVGSIATGGQMFDIGAKTNTLGYANDVNSSGTIVGALKISNGDDHAFLHDGTINGVMHDLGTLGGVYSGAFAVNDNGQIAGYSYTGRNRLHAFRHSGVVGAPMIDLGSLGGDESEAYDINNAGVVVGYAVTADGDSRAALWRPDGSIVDLKAWLDAINPEQGAKWRLAEANAINQHGLIAGIGIYNDGPGGLEDGAIPFLLDASAFLPEPGGVALVVIGMPMLFRRQRLHRVGQPA